MFHELIGPWPVGHFDSWRGVETLVIGESELCLFTSLADLLAQADNDALMHPEQYV